MKRLLLIILLFLIAGVGTVHAQAQSKPKKGQKQKFDKKLSINFARLDELQSLPGLNKEIAQTIIDGRPYDTKQDLVQIDGINEQVLATLDDFIQIRMNINNTSPKELEKLPWITQEIAHEIVEGTPYKILDGDPSKSIYQLVLIDGIDEGLLMAIEDFIEVRMNINTAELKEWQTLPGVTPEIASAIIEKRPYDEVEELLSVNGVDESLLAGIERLIYAEQRRGRKLPGAGR